MEAIDRDKNGTNSNLLQVLRLQHASLRLWRNRRPRSICFWTRGGSVLAADKAAAVGADPRPTLSGIGRRASIAQTARSMRSTRSTFRSWAPAGSRKKGVAYARFSTRFQDSIADQIRTILGHAVELSVYVPRDLIFFDLAVRGFTKNRTGLDGVEKALKGKKATVLLLFSTSRLFRKQYRTLEFVDRMHQGLAVRCVFVKSGVDTDDTQRWKSILYVQSLIDQFVVTMYVANIHSAHEGLLKKQMVFGTLSFGYAGKPIEGEFTNLGRPRCKIIIDEETARIVRQIYDWFVNERLSIEAIVQRLNDDPQIPLPPRAMSDMWTRLAVINVLKNTRYRGYWRYGATEAIYIPDGDYVAQRLRAEPLAAVHIEQLRLVPDALWFAAQARLAERAGHGGRPPLDGNHTTRPKLLNGLLKCRSTSSTCTLVAHMATRCTALFAHVYRQTLVRFTRT